MGKLYKRGGTYYADYYDRDGRRCGPRRGPDREVARATTPRSRAGYDRSRPALDRSPRRRAEVLRRRRVRREADGHDLELPPEGAPPVAAAGDSCLTGSRARPSSATSRPASRRAPHGTASTRSSSCSAARSSRCQRPRTFHGRPSDARFRAAYVPRTTYLTPDQFAALVQHLVPARPAQRKRADLREREERRNRRALYCMLIALASPRAASSRRCAGSTSTSRAASCASRRARRSARRRDPPGARPWLEALAPGTGPVIEPWTNVGRDLPRACERAGVPRCTPNDLRRTFASWLVQAGTSLLVVSRLLGHSSTRMVDLVYGQLDEATLAAAIAAAAGRL
jgi:integrase